MPLTQTAKRVRKAIFNEMVKTGRAPNIPQIMEELRLGKDEVMQGIQELEAGVCIVMEPKTENVRMAHPFANTTTRFEVAVDGKRDRKWYAE